jgi:predicted nucleic acid-binding protein
MILPLEGLTYVDTNPVIYRIERVEPYWSASMPLWEALDDGACRLATSELTWLEVLVKPLREGNLGLVSLFQLVLFQSNLECHPIDISILETAARLRAAYRLKTPDSIHAATALNLHSTAFLTNDRGFLRVPGLNVVILDDVVSSGSANGSV